MRSRATIFRGVGFGLALAIVSAPPPAQQVAPAADERHRASPAVGRIATRWPDVRST